jgi:hypothetical protein
MLSLLALATVLNQPTGLALPGLEAGSQGSGTELRGGDRSHSLAGLFGKKKEKQDPNANTVSVTAAQLTSEDVVGTMYYTLTGSLTNNTEGIVSNVVVYYEIRAEGTGKLITAGTALATPAVLQPGRTAEFTTNPTSSGQVKITLIEWKKPDKTGGSHSQMQMFP